MVVYERKLLPEMRRWVGKKSVLVLTGMRQVGKTTLMRMLFSGIKSKNKAFLDMENPLVRKVFEEQDYDNIWANLKAYGVTKDEKAYVFLDEIQLMPEAVRAVKYLSDHYDIQFFVTGSSSFYLKNLFPESLAGRKTVFELFPLNFEEFLLFKGVKRETPSDFSSKEAGKSLVSFEKSKKFYEEYLEYGGFPKVVLASEPQDKKTVLEDIYTSYFEKEVRSLADFKDINRLQDCILLLAKRVGSRLNLSRIASEIGVSRETIYAYLSFLQSTYFISLVPPYAKSPDREVSGAKKVYLCDTGILNLLSKSSSGSVLENAVFNSLKARDSVAYYQRRSGVEMDFVLKDESIAIEVKETASERDAKRANEIANEIGLKHGYVVSKSYSEAKGILCASDI